ncbi:pyruvate, phosphate dikinase [Amylibacter sp.]|nr:pyruvate, phosphate dikinase [Amylibacter sp.]
MDAELKVYPECVELGSHSEVPTEKYGARANAIVNLIKADLPIPKAWAFLCDSVHKFQNYEFPKFKGLNNSLNQGILVSLRASPISREWGGPETLLNIGMNWRIHGMLKKALGKAAVDALYFRFIQDFATQVARLDAEDFDILIDGSVNKNNINYEKALKSALILFEEETGNEFPQNPFDQLQQSLKSMASAWNSASARILRAARGAPVNAGLGLIVQEMVLGIGDGEFGSGIAQFVSPVTGEEKAYGRYLSQSQGKAAMKEEETAQYLASDKRGPSLEEICPSCFSSLKSYANIVTNLYRDDMQLEFTVKNGDVWLLDATPAHRTGRAAIAIVIRLQSMKLITEEEALMRIAPKILNEILHPQIDPKEKRVQIADGIGASPGAATGKIVFNASSAVALASRGEASILVRIETTPDDIRGMHSANGILTERGGINSHAAVVARTLGLPCVVGVNNINIDQKNKKLQFENGTSLSEGDLITLDGSTGQILSGSTKLIEPELGGNFKQFMNWADKTRTMGVRGNADTPQDVRLAQKFGVDGIGLVRTEHMFFDTHRLNVMRELIFAEKTDDRQEALNLLLPMQREDFFEIFSLMGEQSVCIRLLDPPLHEFLPKSREQVVALAESMDLPLSKVINRVEELEEINPMLGTRGVRLGITVPEIYVMQARAIFEAACLVKKNTGRKIKPEIMIPLVSANREVELVKARVDAVASSVQSETGISVEYSLGVMVETPRAALRAHDIARTVDFMSFGTNDLTQMTYGLSRDDAGRFMREYVNQEIYDEDPFLTLDIHGVGELLSIAADRSRSVKPDILLGLCGEHGGDPESIIFCHEAGFDYVSCSPFRTPIARLAAAQAELMKR